MSPFQTSVKYNLFAGNPRAIAGLFPRRVFFADPSNPDGEGEYDSRSMLSRPDTSHWVKDGEAML